ncbi:MAG TPA: hydantoinase/oxoprolinase family protein, partial [Pseudomonadales bacterium]|nr:hydantoinase/oxoprolinase family protein [Pseudomonadales bacterium]
MTMILGVDTGGTFTDFVLFSKHEIRIHKVLSTPSAPEQAILQGIRALGLDGLPKGELWVVHGSTVATNAALEGKGARTAFVTNRGLKDILTIGRQARRELYNLTPMPDAPPVPADLCFETGGRLSAEGELLEPLTEADIESLLEALQQAKPEAVAICLLFSFLQPDQERRLRAALDADYFVSCSHEVLPDYGEYERGIATWLNASLGPVMRRYLMRLKEKLETVPVTIMQSSGGTLALEQAQSRAVNLMLSGPAGGLSGARFMGEIAGQHQLLTFDMGGTSTDVAVIDGEIRLTSEGRIGRWPVGVPMVDMVTIGAGGGSIAYIDAGGLLQVGPESAGASPGPACYGRGGSTATVTDANLVLGRIQPDFFLGGQMQLDVAAARQALAELGSALGLSTEAAAYGVIRLANEHMVRALRMISVERGYDLTGFALCSFGGAGGLHVCALADALGMSRALVPHYAGVLSAFGMGVAPRVRHLSASHKCPVRQL